MQAIRQEFKKRHRDLVRTISHGESSWTTTLRDRSDAESTPGDAWWQSYLRGCIPKPSPDARTIRILDVFSGCGGLSLGAEQAALAVGARPAFLGAVDVDRGALDVYSHNLDVRIPVHDNARSLVDFSVTGRGDSALFAYPPEVLHRDLGRQVGNIDLFLAGPPCQGHSNLNNRSRREDPRNQLYLEAVALAVALNARAIVVENVPEVTSDRSGVVATARTLLTGSGYTFVDGGRLSADSLGAAQTRRRYFLIAVRADTAPAPCTLKQAAAAFAVGPRSVSWAIGDLVDSCGTEPMDSVPELSDDNKRRIDFLFDHDEQNLPNRQRPDCHKNGTTYKSVYGRMYWDRPAQTITTGFMSPGRGRFVHPLRRRTLTAREAARIQFFPDSFDFTCGGVRPPTKSELAKWIGDAVPPILGYVATMPAMLSLSDARRPKT